MCLLLGGCHMFGFDEDGTADGDAGALDGGDTGGDGDGDSGDGDGDSGDGDGDSGDGDGDATGDCEDPDGDDHGTGPDCLGSDCNEDDPSVHEGAAESCNGGDDDCDGAIDEDADSACYEGPEGTEGVGICHAGIRRCVDGQSGPCVGAVVPAGEACNLLDDDCNGFVDDPLPVLSCGIGECAASVDSCDGGHLQQCVPSSPGSEQGNCGDGLDNDCNGLVDDCLCVHVSPAGDDIFGDGSAAGPLLTIAAGIALAQQPGQPPRVCLGARNNGACQWTLYQEPVTMVDGIGVSGGWDTAMRPWVQRPLHGANQGCVTEIQSTTTGTPAVKFGPTVASSTPLDNVVASVQNPADEAVTVLIEGSEGALIRDAEIHGASNSGPGTHTTGLRITHDPATGSPARPIVVGTSVNGGAGETGTAIHSINSTTTIQGSCSPNNIQPSGRCLGGCGNGIAIRANRFQGQNVTLPVNATAILLENSPGSTVDQSVVCGGGTDDVEGIRIEGSGAGVIVSRNDVVVWGGLTDNGIHATNCKGRAPWIVDNERIGAEGNYPLGTAIAAAVRATGECHPVVERNAMIVGGVEGAVRETYGVFCGADPASGKASLCSVVDNLEIRGSNSNVPTLSVGMRCEAGACNVIRGNGLIWGRAGVDVAGLQLVGPTRAFVDRNVIRGGCGVTSSIGLLTDDAAARLQNNVIDGGLCESDAQSDHWYGVRAVLSAGVHELDLHSNSILGGGTARSACTSRGIAFDVDALAKPAGGLGVLRNNIVDAGGCPTRYAVEEADAAADPRIFEHDDLWPTAATALYRDEGAANLSTAAQVNALTDMQVHDTLDADPMWTADPGNGLYRLGAASLCRDAGEIVDVPTHDFEGDPRPAGDGPDIGADELP